MRVSRSQPVSDALRATTSGSEPSAAWRPIESAPKDGTKVLVGRFTGKSRAHQEGRQAVDFYHVRAMHGYDGWGQFNSHAWPATHWMPLPSPPLSAKDTTGVSDKAPGKPSK